MPKSSANPIKTRALREINKKMTKLKVPKMVQLKMIDIRSMWEMVVPSREESSKAAPTCVWGCVKRKTEKVEKNIKSFRTARVFSLSVIIAGRREAKP